MLQFLHSTATGLFAKILLFLLIASFAVWGIGDIFRTTPNDAVVTVGDSVITAQEFQREYQAEQANFRRMLGNSYTNDLLMSLNIPQQVLRRLIEKHLLREEAKEQGVVVPESHLLTLLAENPNFQGENGRFDPTLFRNVLASSGLSEAQYLSLLADEIRNQMLVDAVIVGVSAPEIAARLNYLHKKETRIADLLVFPPSLIETLPEPEEEQLRAYYQQHSVAFTAPEFRSFSAVLLDYDTLAQTIEVPEDELRAEYKDRAEELHVPETREVEQLLLSTQEEAQTVLEALRGGLSMQAAVAQFDTVNEDVSLGNITADGIMAEAEDVVFSINAGEYSDPVESAFGWHVFHVKDIHPARIQSFEEVKDRLQRELRNDWAENEIYSLSNRLQDELAIGTSLEDAAKEAGLKRKTFGPVNRAGQDPKGNPVNLPEGFDDLLEVAFELPEGEVSTLFETPAGSYYAVRVDSVIPEQVRDFADVKDTVLENWRKEERRNRLQQLAKGIATQLKDENVEEVAAKTGALLLKRQEFTRATTEVDDGVNVPAPLVVELFSLDEGGVTSAVALRDGGFAVAELQAVRTPEANAQAQAKIESLRSDLSSRLSNEVYAQYMAYLQQKHGVSPVNRAVLESLLPE